MFTEWLLIVTLWSPQSLLFDEFVSEQYLAGTYSTELTCESAVSALKEVDITHASQCIGVTYEGTPI